MKTQYPERELPIIKVKGVEFYVDAYRSELIEKDNKENRINKGEMLVFEDHSEFLFDTRTRNLYYGRVDLPLPEEVDYVWMRTFNSIDPVGWDMFCKEKYGTPWYDNNAELPILEIQGKQFYIDDYRNTFRDVDNKWNNILFKDVTIIDGKHALYFNTEVNNTAFPHEIEMFDKGLAPHIKIAHVPSGYELADLLKSHKKQMAPKRVVYHMDKGSVKRKKIKI